MFKLVRRVGKYISTAASMKFDEKSDPKVQLTQAIEEAQDQHRKLKQQAANVIANQKQTEMRLNRKISELEQTTQSARQAVLLADEAEGKGDSGQLAEYTRVAEALAGRMVALESDIESLKELHFQTTQAANQAKTAVTQNATALQKRLNERQKLLSQIDQTKMQEQLNKTMTQLSERVGEDVPTLEQVRNKIEERYAKALGAAELIDENMDLKMLQVEQAALDAEARARLGTLRTQLGLPASTASAGELTSATPTDDDVTDAETIDDEAEPVATKPARKASKRKSAS